jgi:hypothetical protein
MRLTVSHLVTRLVAIVASGGRLLSLDNLLLAMLADMAHFVAVAAVRDRLLNHHSGIVEAGKDLLVGLGPSLELTGTLWLVVETVRDGILAVQIPLEIHVGVRREQLALCCNEIEAQLVAHDPLLELAIRDVGAGLDVLFNGILDIVHVALLDGRLEFDPGFVGGRIRNIAAIDDPGVLTLGTRMA